MQVIDLGEASGIVRAYVVCAEQGEVGEGKPCLDRVDSDDDTSMYLEPNA